LIEAPVSISFLLLATLAASPVHSPAAPVCHLPTAAPSDTLQATFESGVPFATFLAGAQNRKEQWVANYAGTATIDATLVARAAAVAGKWKLLVVSVDSCSDSVNTVPHIARLIDLLPNVEMRLVTPDQGRAIMESHRTPDDRAATPTVVLLDENWQERGCFVERPPVLRQHMDSLPSSAKFSGKMSWYEQDAGRSTVAEIVAMLEAAGKGEVQCR
jgi:hypothetical protein